MTKIFLSKIADFVDQEVEVSGWVQNFRSSGKISFWEVRDGTGYAQAVLDSQVIPTDQWELAKKVTLESAVKLVGTVSKHPKNEEYELQVKYLEYYQVADEYPLGKKEHGTEFLLDNRHLWLRSSKQVAIQKIRNTVIQGIYEYMQQNNFTKIDAPILTPNACEGTTELFEMEYFDQKAYLSQSGQLYIEAALPAHNRVFDFGPVFRAEKSKTRRHLTEFWMMDAEMAFIDLAGNMQIQEELIRHIVRRVLKHNAKELEVLERDIKPLQNIDRPFHKITHAEAVQWLQEHGSKITTEDDLGAEDETLLTKNFDNPVFVTHYPAKVKAFYMKRNEKNPDLAECADLLAPEGYGEIIGGSQREDDYETLLKRIIDHKLPVKEFEWYLDLRKYGSVPHGGFGIGLERTVGWICGTHHVRETIPFPRTIYRLRP